MNSLMGSAQVVDSDGMTHCMYILLLLVNVILNIANYKLHTIYPQYLT